MARNGRGNGAAAAAPAAPALAAAVAVVGVRGTPGGRRGRLRAASASDSASAASSATSLGWMYLSQSSRAHRSRSAGGALPQLSPGRTPRARTMAAHVGSA